jgi:hypothetical protein
MTPEVVQLVERIEQVAALLRERMACGEPFSEAEALAMRDLIRVMRDQRLLPRPLEERAIEIDFSRVRRGDMRRPPR